MAKTALLVMEMQNDYLWEKRREKFTYDSASLIAGVNEAIAAAQAAGDDIIYIAQIYPDTPTNHLVFGCCIEQTEGVKLCPEVSRVSDLYFEKNVADMFTDEKFAAFAAEQGYTHIMLCGIDLCGGIAATAKGAAAQGIRVGILQKASATRLDTRRKAKTRAELMALGVTFK